MKKFEDYNIHINGNQQQKTICPECTPLRQPGHQHRKDLSVNPEKGVWFCHHCYWAGSLTGEATFVYDVKPVAPITATNTGWLYSYFAKRNISKEVVDHYKVKEHVRKAGMKYIKEIAFPFCFGETVFNYKFRTEDKQFRQVAGVEFTSFFNINVAIAEREVVITEGEIDVLSFAEAGVWNAISVPNGAPNADAKDFHREFKYIDDSADILKNVDVFYLALDMDKNGVRLREELARRLGKRKCQIVEFPEGCKDANDVLQSYGKEVLRQCLKNSYAYPIEGVFAVKDFIDEVNEIYRNGYPNGAKTGWPSLDSHLNLYPGQLTIVTGIPNSGKSPFTDNLMMNLSENEGWRHAVFSPENGSISNHIIRLIRQYKRKNFFPGYHGRCTEADVTNALAFVNDHFYFVNPANERYTIEKILEGFEYLVTKYGVRLVLIDPWNTLEHHKPKDESETNYVGRTLNRFKYFARDMGVHFVLIAHPRVPEKYYLNYVPNLYSISGSANWYNIPDIGVIVHRHMAEDKKTTEYNQIVIEKMKFDWVGSRGAVKLDFEVASQRFFEQGKDHKFVYDYSQEPF